MATLMGTPTLRLIFCLVVGMTVLAPSGSLWAQDKPPASDAFAPSTMQFDFANGLLSRRLYKEAVTEYAKFLRLYPRDNRSSLAIFYRGEARFSLGKYRLAARDFYAFLKQKKNPQKRNLALLRYGCCQFELKQFSGAVQTLRLLLAMKNIAATTVTTAHYYLGRSLQVEKKYSAALTALTKVQTGELAPLALYSRAEILAITGKHAAAAQLFSTFTKTYPAHAMAAAATLSQGDELRAAGSLAAAAQSFTTILKNPHLSVATLAQARYGLAWVRYNEKKFAAAQAAAARVLNAPPASLHPGAQYLIGLAQYQRKKYASAIASFRQVREGSYAELALRQIVWAQLAAGDGAAALRTVAAHREKYPHLAAAELNYLEGKARMQQRAYAEAIPVFQKILTAKNKNAEFTADASYALALCYADLGQHDKAARAFAHFVKNWAEDTRVLQALIGQGRALLEQQKYAPALVVYGRIRERKKVGADTRQAAMNQEAVCYYRLKQYANMRRVYTEILKKFPTGNAAPEALYWLAWYEGSVKRFLRAADFYADLIKRFPQHRLVPAARYRRAMSLYHGGKEKAAADLLFAIVMTDKAPAISEQELLWVGTFYMNTQNYSRASAVYQHLLAGKPSAKVRAVSLYRLAKVKRLQEKWAEALVAYSTLVTEKIPGLLGAARFGMAVCQRHLGKFAKARKLLAEVRLAPGDPLIAQVHLELGHLDFAAQHYQKAAAHWMRVGLLYDDEALCGEALYWATRASLKAGDRQKAQVCVDEISGKTPGGYGTRYPQSSYIAKTVALLQPPAKSQTRVPEVKGTP